jgi:hypothetical protein
MADPSADPVADLLSVGPGTKTDRAAAWDAFHQSANLDELTSKLKPLAIPNYLKAQLWDLKAGNKPQSVVPTATGADALAAIGRARATGTTAISEENSPIMEAAGEMAHPQTLTDVARLITSGASPRGISGAGEQAAVMAEAAKPKVVAGLAKTGTALENLGSSRLAEYGGGVGAVSEIARGDYKGAVISAGIPFALQYLGKGMRTLSEILDSTGPLKGAEIAALRVKLMSPALANNQMARQAIATAIRTRGGTP